MNVATPPPHHTPRHMDTPAARSSREVHEQGFHAGKDGLPLPSNATPIYRQAWNAGAIERRAHQGEVIAVQSQASKCNKCLGVVWGHRKGCKCWPSTSDMRELAVDGYSMEWGMLVANFEGKDSGSPKQGQFMSREELIAARDRGLPILDALTGKALLVKDA